MNDFDSPINETKRLAQFLDGMGAAATLATQHDIATVLHRAALYLHKLSNNICAHGVVGCSGGASCKSDHK